MSDEKVFEGEIVGEIELPKLDLSQYVGRDTVIISATPLSGSYKGEPTVYVKFESDVVDTIKKKDGEDIVLRASQIVGLQRSEDGKVGWGAETNMGKLLKRFGVAHFKDVIGKRVKVQLTKPNADGNQYLTFA